MIPGVEISTFYEECEIHLLGLFIEPTCRELTAALLDMAQKRKERNRAMIQKLHDAGLPISAAGFSPGNRHGYPDSYRRTSHRERTASSPMEAVQTYMTPGGVGYVPKARFHRRNAPGSSTQQAAP